jgi:hypothetical protein
LTKDVIAIVKVDEETLIDAIPLFEIKSVMEMNAMEQNGEGGDLNASAKSQNSSFKTPKRGLVHALPHTAIILIKFNPISGSEHNESQRLGKQAW